MKSIPGILFSMAGALLGLALCLALHAGLGLWNTLFTPVSFMLSMGLAGWLIWEMNVKGGERECAE